VNKSNQGPELKGMGTTLTMAYAHGGEVVLAHVGDSRAYLVDGLDHHIFQFCRHSFSRFIDN